MRLCWERKSKDRPTFAALVPALQTALDKQCPDRSLIPKPHGMEEQNRSPDKCPELPSGPSTCTSIGSGVIKPQPGHDASTNMTSEGQPSGVVCLVKYYLNVLNKNIEL